MTMKLPFSTPQEAYQHAYKEYTEGRLAKTCRYVDNGKYCLIGCMLPEELIKELEEDYSRNGMPFVDLQDSIDVELPEGMETEDLALLQTLYDDACFEADPQEAEERFAEVENILRTLADGLPVTIHNITITP